MKKAFTLLLVLIAVIGLLPIQAYASGNESDDDGGSSPLVLKNDSDDDDDMDDDDDSDEDDSEDENEIEIEVDLKGTSSRVKIENNDVFTSFILETTDKETIIQEIVSRTDLTEEQVRANIKYGSVPDFRNREQMKEKLEMYKERLEQIKENRETWLEMYKKKKEQYEEFKDQWDSARDDWRKFKGNVEDFDNLSEEDQQEIIEKLKKFMTKTIDRMQSHTEILERWVNNADITNDTSDNLTAEIDRVQEDLEDFRTRINDTTNITDLRELGQEIRDYWQDNKHIMKKTISNLFDLRMDHLLDKFETISDNLQSRIDSLEADGEDVTEMQDLLNSFNEKVSLADQELAKAKEIYNGITSENQEEQYELAKERLKTAHNYLKEAHEDLKELIKLFRETELGKTTDLAELTLTETTI